MFRFRRPLVEKIDAYAREVYRNSGVVVTRAQAADALMRIALKRLQELKR